jgi:hypothetical protein
MNNLQAVCRELDIKSSELRSILEQLPNLQDLVRSLTARCHQWRKEARESGIEDRVFHVSRTPSGSINTRDAHYEKEHSELLRLSDRWMSAAKIHHLVPNGDAHARLSYLAVAQPSDIKNSGGNGNVAGGDDDSAVRRLAQKLRQTMGPQHVGNDEDGHASDMHWKENASSQSFHVQTSSAVKRASPPSLLRGDETEVVRDVGEQAVFRTGQDVDRKIASQRVMSTLGGTLDYGRLMYELQEAEMKRQFLRDEYCSLEDGARDSSAPGDISWEVSMRVERSLQRVMMLPDANMLPSSLTQPLHSERDTAAALKAGARSSLQRRTNYSKPEMAFGRPVDRSSEIQATSKRTRPSTAPPPPPSHPMKADSLASGARNAHGGSHKDALSTSMAAARGSSNVDSVHHAKEVLNRNNIVPKLVARRMSKRPHPEPLAQIHAPSRASKDKGADARIAVVPTAHSHATTVTSEPRALLAAERKFVKDTRVWESRSGHCEDTRAWSETYAASQQSEEETEMQHDGDDEWLVAVLLVQGHAYRDANAKAHIARVLTDMIDVPADHVQVADVGVDAAAGYSQVTLQMTQGAKSELERLARDATSPLWVKLPLMSMTLAGVTFTKSNVMGSPPRHDHVSRRAAEDMQGSPQLIKDYEQVMSGIAHSMSESFDALHPELSGCSYIASVSSKHEIVDDDNEGMMPRYQEAAPEQAVSEESVVRWVENYVSHHMYARLVLDACAKRQQSADTQPPQELSRENIRPQTLSSCATRLLGAEGLQLLMEAGAEMTDAEVLSLASDALLHTAVEALTEITAEGYSHPVLRQATTLDPLRHVQQRAGSVDPKDLDDARACDADEDLDALVLRLFMRAVDLQEVEPEHRIMALPRNPLDSSNLPEPVPSHSETKAQFQHDVEHKGVRSGRDGVPRTPEGETGAQTKKEDVRGRQMQSTLVAHGVAPALASDSCVEQPLIITHAGMRADPGQPLAQQRADESPTRMSEAISAEDSGISLQATMQKIADSLQALERHITTQASPAPVVDDSTDKQHMGTSLTQSAAAGQVPQEGAQPGNDVIQLSLKHNATELAGEIARALQDHMQKESEGSSAALLVSGAMHASRTFPYQTSRGLVEGPDEQLRIVVRVKDAACGPDEALAHKPHAAPHSGDENASHNERSDVDSPSSSVMTWSERDATAVGSPTLSWVSLLARDAAVGSPLESLSSFDRDGRMVNIPYPSASSQEHTHVSATSMPKHTMQNWPQRQDADVQTMPSLHAGSAPQVRGMEYGRVAMPTNFPQSALEAAAGGKHAVPESETESEDDSSQDDADAGDSLSEGEMPAEALGLRWSMSVWSPRSSEGELPTVILAK